MSCISCLLRGETSVLLGTYLFCCPTHEPMRREHEASCLHSTSFRSCHSPFFNGLVGGKHPPWSNILEDMCAMVFGPLFEAERDGPGV